MRKILIPNKLDVRAFVGKTMPTNLCVPHTYPVCGQRCYCELTRDSSCGHECFCADCDSGLFDLHPVPDEFWEDPYRYKEDDSSEFAPNELLARLVLTEESAKLVLESLLNPPAPTQVLVDLIKKDL